MIAQYNNPFALSKDFEPKGDQGKAIEELVDGLDSGYRFQTLLGATGTGKYVLFEEYNGGTWTGPDDQTSAVQVVYDNDKVYFGFVVTDDYHENAANSAS